MYLFSKIDIGKRKNMFYREDEINNELLCRKCGKKFDDPRLLSCGETLCNKCILSLVNSQTNQFECLFCGDNHKLSTELPENKLIQKLVGIKSKPVYRGKEIEKFKLVLANLEKRCSDLKQINQTNSISEIRNYSDYIRSDIELITESTIQYVNRFYNELIEKVNEYEKECVTNIENSGDQFKNFEQLLVEIGNFSKHWSEYLKNFEFNLDDINLALRIGNQHLKTLQLEEVKQKRIKFNDRMLKFKENPTQLNSKLLGEIFYSTKITPVNNQFIAFIDLKQLLATNFDHICVEKLANQRLAVVYSSIENDFSTNAILLSSEEPWTIIGRAELGNHRFDVLLTAKHDNSLFVCFVINFKNEIIKFDENLNVCKSISFDSPINSLASNNANIFAWSSIGSKILTFNPELELIQELALNVQSPELPYYLPRFICKTFADDRNFYLLDYDFNLILMSLEGRVIRRFKIDCNNFFLSEQMVLSHDRENSQIIYFDVELGEQIKLRQLGSNLPYDLTLVNTSNFCEMFFFSNLEKALYVFLT